MGTLMRTVIVIILASATTAHAADGSVVKGSAFLIILFLGFAALIIVFQFIPGLVLFATMLKSLFSRAPKKATETLSDKSGGK
jgi:hypothetical protein